MTPARRRVVDTRTPVHLALGLVAAAGAAVAIHSACLVESLCLSDSDCPYPQRCLAGGECGLECSASALDACPAARPECLVEELRCVECLEAEDCPGAEECVGNSCVPAVAPGFALLDRNPESPTLGLVYSLEGQRGSVVLLFFAGLG